jgi:lysophospholipase L1-like esterase
VLRIVSINLAVFAALALAALGAAELWLRLTVPPSSEESIFEYTLATPRYKVMRPGASIVAWGKELRTNDLGFRDDSPSIPAKQPGELRIVVLGDSMTVSAGVDHAAIFTTLLEKRLRAAHPGVQVINLAVGGYNIEQYEMVLHEVALGLKPDFVLVAICAENDFTVHTIEGNRRVAMGLEAPPSLEGVESLYVYRAYLNSAFSGIGRLLERATGTARASSGGAGSGWERNSAALHRIVRDTRAQGLPIAAVVLPQAHKYERQQAQFARIASLCRQEGLECLDLLQRFGARGVPPSSLGLNPLDRHPNDRYNALVAEELAPFVERMLGAADRPSRL